ncbi:MAG: spermidine/putrescine ABC transporter substrate-binding protein [Betaproteobacteria bacterium]|nr:spermidine/putrescine ABC transporter substrate-binding protein [Betaproteobacteria bacterium]
MKRTLLAALALTSASAMAKNEVLHLYNWNQYIDPQTVARFEKACECKVKQSYFGDNEEMVAKLAAGAKGYDLMVPTSNYIQGMAKNKQIQPLDHAKLPNLKNLGAAYMNTAFDPGNQYSVPYAYTITMLGYNEQKMKELGITVDSWAAIFDPKILEKMKKKVTVLDSQNELMAAALRYLGYSVNERDPKKWDEAKAVILKAKPYWAAFKATGYIEDLAAGRSWLVHGYSNDIYQADLGAQEAKQPFRIRHALPKEGAVLALDVMVLGRHSKQTALAHKFIDFMLDGQNSADLTNMIGAGNPNTAAQQFIKPEIKAMKAIFPDGDAAKKLEMLSDMKAAERRLLNRLWTQIKAAK